MPIDLKYIAGLIDKVEGAASGKDAKVDFWLPSGNYALNRAISGDYFKGLPFGRVIEVFGDPSTGKSLLMYHWIAEVQKMGGIAILDDPEDAYTEKFGKLLGIDNDAIIMLNSLTVEEHFEKVFLGWRKKGKEGEEGKKKMGLVDLIWEKDTECPILICLDSLALLSTRHEQAVQLDKADMSKAKQIRSALRNSASYMRRGRIMHVVANHVTSKIGVVFGNPKTTPGGTGIPFSASVRLELTYGGKLKDVDNTDKVIGVMATAKGSKNKVAAPFQEAHLDIYFDKGVDPLSGLFESLLVNGILKQALKDDGTEKKGYFDIFGEQLRKGEFNEFIKKNISKLSSVKTKEDPKSNPKTP